MLHNLAAVDEGAAASSGFMAAKPFQWRDPSSIPPRKWIYGNSLLRGSVSLLVAPGASGKTALTAGMAVSLATGRSTLGKEVWGGPKRVLLWNLEDSQDEISKLLHASFIHWKVEEPDIADRLFVNSGLDGDNLVTATDGQDGFKLNEQTLADLAHLITVNNIDVLIVDPFVSSHQVSENDNGAIDAVAKAWAQVAKDTGCAVLLVHHSRKLSGMENTADASRGASALVNAARSVLTINRMDKGDAERFGIEDEDRHRFIRVYDDKNNRAPPAGKSDWFRMESVSLGNGPLNSEGDSLPVLVPWSPPDAFADVTTDDLRRVQSVVASADWRKDPQCGNWAGYAVAQALGLNGENKADRAKIKQLLSTWLKNGVLKVVSKNDDSRQKRPFIVVGRPLDATGATPLEGVAVQGGAVTQ